MIYVGIDDTDTLETRGTNQLARALARRVESMCRCRTIVRHQLLYDSRIPFTSKNGSASLCFEPLHNFAIAELIDILKHEMQADFYEGSDPGLCVTTHVPAAITEYAFRCQREVMEQSVARDLAAQHGIHLEGLGGTEGGVIGALAAVGLIVTGNDGRVIQFADFPDDLQGVCECSVIQARGVSVRHFETQQTIAVGRIDVGKHLRPNLRDGGVVLFVRPSSSEFADWEAVKLV